MGPEFLTWRRVEELHQSSLERFGGSDGVRDLEGLKSALAAAENTHFYGCGDVHEIAAAYAYHVSESQGFIDGNKRTGVACAIVFLEANGCADESDNGVLYDALIDVAAGRLDKSGLAALLRQQFPLR